MTACVFSEVTSCPTNDYGMTLFRCQATDSFGGRLQITGMNVRSWNPVVTFSASSVVILCGQYVGSDKFSYRCTT